MNPSISDDLKNDLDALPETMHSALQQMQQATITDTESEAFSIRLTNTIASQAGEHTDTRLEPQAVQSNSVVMLWEQLIMWLQSHARLSATTFASLSLVVITSMLVSTGMPTAFAQVVEALSQVNQMTYRATMSSKGDVIMRNNVYYKRPGLTRTEMLNAEDDIQLVTVTNASAGKSMILMPQQQVAMPVQFEPQSDEKLSASENPMQWYYAILNAKPDQVEVLPSEYFYGMEVDRYRLNVPNMQIDLWVNPSIALPIQMQLHSLDGEQSFSLTAEIDYQQFMDDSLFDLTPSGYQIVGPDTD